MVCAHEVNGRGLEAGLTSNTLEKKPRSIRVKSCSVNQLKLGEGEPIDCVSNSYPIPHEKYPTLLVRKEMSKIDVKFLAKELGKDLSYLIDTRFESFETALLRLEQEQNFKHLSNNELADAVDCPVHRIEEIRATIKQDFMFFHY